MWSALTAALVTIWLSRLVLTVSGSSPFAATKIPPELAELLGDKEAQIGKLAAAAASSYRKWGCGGDPGSEATPAHAQAQCWLEACTSALPQPECVLATGSTFGQCTAEKPFRVLDFSTSAVRMADSIESSRPGSRVLNDARWSLGLDAAFETGSAVPSTSWQYFGSVHGMMRSYPASAKRDCYKYDNRARPWYVAATSSPKDVVIAIDTSGSMSRKALSAQYKDTLSLAKAAAVVALKTLTQKDYVAVVRFDDRGQQLCGDVRSELCIRWWQSTTCTGARSFVQAGHHDQLGDRPCGQVISEAQAGYCECEDGTTAEFDCGHAPFSCSDVCSGRAVVGRSGAQARACNASSSSRDDRSQKHIPCGSLAQATSANVKALEDMVKSLNVVGSTDPESGVTAAFALFDAASTGVDAVAATASSGCNRALILLTDGVRGARLAPGSTRAAAARLIAVNEAREHRATMFTYSVGGGADSSFARALACGSNGLWSRIDGSSDLQTIMRGASDYFAIKGEPRPRWTKPYVDSSGAGEMTTVAQPVYHFVDGGTSKELLGVVGIDVLIDDIAAVASEAGVDVVTAFASRDPACVRDDIDPCTLRQLRDVHSTSGGGALICEDFAGIVPGSASCTKAPANTECDAAAEPDVPRCAARNISYSDATCGSVCDTAAAALDTAGIGLTDAVAPSSGSSNGSNSSVSAAEADTNLLWWESPLPDATLGEPYEMPTPTARFDNGQAEPGTVRSQEQQRCWYRDTNELGGAAGLTLEARSGRVFGVPTKASVTADNPDGVFELKLHVKCLSGYNADVRVAGKERRILLKVHPSRLFSLSSTGTVKRNVLRNRTEKFDLDKTHAILGPALAKQQLFINAADEIYDRISYRFGDFSVISVTMPGGPAATTAVATNAPGLFLVEPTTGEMLLQPKRLSEPGTVFKTSLEAVDVAGATVLVRELTFTVQLKPAFRVLRLERQAVATVATVGRNGTVAAAASTNNNDYDNNNGGCDGKARYLSMRNVTLAVGQLYRIGEIDLARSNFENAALDSSISFTIDERPKSPALRFLIDPDTGLIQGGCFVCSDAFV